MFDLQVPNVIKRAHSGRIVERRANCGFAAIVVQRPHIKVFQAGVSEKAAITACNIADESCFLHFTRIRQQRMR